MNKISFIAGTVFVLLTSFSQRAEKSVYSFSITKDSIPEKNQEVIAYAEKHGRLISPTYEKAVCTELLIGVLKKFVELTKEDKKRIRIISNEDIYMLRKSNSPIPKGVYYALTENGKGIPIDTLADVKPGDFVQFWYVYWGHCGIVKSLNIPSKSMDLYSSFPSTNGFGVQTFTIPEECYFVRLR